MGPSSPTGPQQPQGRRPTIQSDSPTFIGTGAGAASGNTDMPRGAGGGPLRVVGGFAPSALSPKSAGPWPRTTPRPRSVATKPPSQTFFMFMPPSPFQH